MSGIDRREFLRIMGVMALGLVLNNGCSNSNDNPRFEKAEVQDFNDAFDNLFQAAFESGLGQKKTRWGAKEENIVEIEFADGDGDPMGTLILEEGFAPSRILGAYFEESTARTVDLTFKLPQVSRYLVASWHKQPPLRFLPPQEYIDRQHGVVKPYLMSPDEIEEFIALMYASYNAPLKKNQTYFVTS